MPNKPSSAHQAKQSSHLAPRDEQGAWQSRKLQEGLTQRRKGAKFRRASEIFAPLRLCVRSKTRPQGPRHLELATTPWNVWMRLACVVVGSGLMTSCLKFGEELEFFEPNVTAKHLEVIEKRTGIDLPQGAVGMALYSDATGIDPWMLAKIKIPSDKVAAMLASKPFISPPPKTPTSINGPTRPWWKPQDLSKASSGLFDDNSALVTWTLGQEKNDQMLYIGWHTF